MIGRQKLCLVIAILIFSFSLTKAQTLQGTLVNDNLPVIGALVVLEGTDFEAVTNARGIFRIYDVPSGEYTLLVDIDDKSYSQGLVNVGNSDTNLGELNIEAVIKANESLEIGVITIDDNDFDDNSNLGTGTSSILNASRDPFVSAAAFNLSVGRFRQRGYGNEDQHMYLNGMPVNDLDDGRVSWATWGGLNDILRVGSANYDLDASQFAFGGMLGSRNIDLSASVQRPQTKLVLNRTNRSYQNRIMLTHSSGEQANGWAYTLSASRRWGDSGYTEGTFYDSYSYALLVDKRINDKHLLNFAVLGSPTQRGRNGVSTQEAYDLAGTNYYNPNWGYQNGEVRNSRVSSYHQPYFSLRHDWNIGENTLLRTSLGYHTGYFANSRLDWFDAPDPRPDYYKKLPSYQLTEETQTAVADYLTEDPSRLQVDFDRMYEINGNSIRTFENANGSGESITGAFSRYIIEDQHFDNKKYSANTVFSTYLNENMQFTAGASYIKEINHQYREIVDLLGGEFYIDLDKFAERDFPDNPDFAQNDLQNPNRVLDVGDSYGWDFDIVTDRAEAWVQNSITLNKVDFFISGKVSQSSFHRFGYYQNGKFPDNSLGKSEVYSFTNFGGKLGATYKLDGRNYLYARGSYRTRAPFSRNAFLSARTRAQVSPTLVNETIYGGEAGYVFRYPGIKGRITAFYTEFKDQQRSRNIYFEATNSFGNYLMTGIDEKHQGLELGAEVKLTSTITATFAGSLGAYQYNNRPNSGFTADNDAINPEIRPVTDSELFLKNLYLPGVQNAGSLTLEYRSPKFWFVNVTGNYFNNMNIDLFPERRTDAAVENVVTPGNVELYNDIIDQYDLDDQFALNLFAGKSWKISDYFLMFNISVNNVLNNKEFITGGFEQFRYRDQEPNYFPERLFYAWGTNYSVGLTIRY